MQYSRTLGFMLVAAVAVASLNGCLAAAAGVGTWKALEGDDAYVCRTAPNAKTKADLQTLLVEGSDNYPDRKSPEDPINPVTVEATDTVAVNGETRAVARVTSQHFDDREYWIVESALCQE